MNRLVIIGNGFDLAHGLNTSYMDFIKWYWVQRVDTFVGNQSEVSEDCLCQIKILDKQEFPSWANFAWQYSHARNIHNERKHEPTEVLQTIKNNPEIFNFSCTSFFRRITHSIENKGWVDIENEYYQLLKENVSDEDACKSLNNQLDFLKSKLVEYLIDVLVHCDSSLLDPIRKEIIAPLWKKDIAISSIKDYFDFLDNRILSNKDWLPHFNDGGFGRSVICNRDLVVADYEEAKKSTDFDSAMKNMGITALLESSSIMLLNFNYTNIADRYFEDEDNVKINHIHGDVADRLCPDSIIFGYGDELDKDYENIKNKNNNEYLRNLKNAHYSEATNYRDMLQFIESDKYQVYIMGHSCGNSDRTLLNTIFEHDNCVSIKPYYYEWIDKDGKKRDNYIDIVQNISRNFTDMKKMRDRVVNKTFCQPLPQRGQ